MPKVSIGLPVYNGEEFIHKRLESILNQTFTNFELIISDNASSDKTPNICEEYAKKDKRIRYVRQKKNMGAKWNFNFVLQEAKFEYFVWAAVDDIWLPSFLEKNIMILESKKNVVASMSKFRFYGELNDPLIKKKVFLKKIGLRFGSKDAHPISGSYENRIRTFFKKSQWIMFYAIFRTDKLLLSYIPETFVSWDQACNLNALKYGDMDVVDEVLLHLFRGGTSATGAINLARLQNRGFIQIVFPYYPFTRWCAKNLGKKIFLKNLDRFIRLNFLAEISLIITALILKKNKGM